ncbi:hypothetical protein IHQ71_19125 [Rhizobium sp. TH2]|uniref:hypothetical protein n=1 Tax=Rhizobium sp. TH2 TaxID=2775403 RepID=UPI0021586111|nr:hypothetical protein [Rhizobium sp. TH2]UVC07311.1 hypothetical protein IHQ71_19125 [Rhizobium sp. TH2]
MDSASIPSIYRTAWTSTKFNLGFTSAGTVLNLLLSDAYEPILIAVPLVFGALFSAIVGLTRHRTVRENVAASGLIILSEAIVLSLQLSLMQALLRVPQSADSNLSHAIPGLLAVYVLALIAIRFSIAVHDKFSRDQ